MVFKALADPGRRKLLDVLNQHNGQALNGLCRHLAMSRQAVTKHLTVLRKAGLVVALWNGREKLHFLNPAPLHQVGRDWIGKYEERIPLALRELEAGIEKIGRLRVGRKN
jgi:DNA-binding transcriptional ArsR family regulator